eukprot:CAMPEP_0184496786 /NCGR_PEP_ID=MMETSP0113_2-20130426/34848_1 /TAXON_ID=91329 /ORGANISM="Norrisiella sphaerica, Strain BC52" /LENGTH=233 /DNA_ID=CAMNT_0026883583 /DNA_START=140 /DNA_END=838 /DNA_ORIENTATION=+
MGCQFSIFAGDHEKVHEHSNAGSRVLHGSTLALDGFSVHDDNKPVHWVCYKNEEGVRYYVDTKTGISTWDEPNSPVVVGNSGRAERRKSSILETHEHLQKRMKDIKWVRYIDDASGIAYYKNISTGETTWDKPENFVVNLRDVRQFSVNSLLSRDTSIGADSETEAKAVDHAKRMSDIFGSPQNPTGVIHEEASGMEEVEEEVVEVTLTGDGHTKTSLATSSGDAVDIAGDEI